MGLGFYLLCGALRDKQMVLAPTHELCWPGTTLIRSPAKEVSVALEHRSQFCYAEQLLQALV